MAANHLAVEQRTHPSLLARIKGEYLESPGLRLTTPQAQRLWGLDDTVCRQALEELIDAHFLTRFPNGSIGRRG